MSYFIDAQCTKCGHEGKHEHTPAAPGHGQEPDLRYFTECCECHMLFNHEEVYVPPSFETKVRMTEEIISQDPDCSQAVVDASIELADQLIDFHKQLTAFEVSMNRQRYTYSYLGLPYVPIWEKHTRDVVNGWWFRDGEKMKVVIDIVDLVCYDSNGNVVE